jgi:hypothetical protein
MRLNANLTDAYQKALSQSGLGQYTSSNSTYTYPNFGPDPYFPNVTGSEPKYPGHQCETYGEFRTFIRGSSDVPQWVKEIVEKLDVNDPWMAEMWSGIFSRWSQRRVGEINNAAKRLTAK